MNQIGTTEELKKALIFASGQKLAVLSTVSLSNEPESALMGIAVTPDFEIVFDRSRPPGSTATCAQPRVALVIGCVSETTVQYEGVAEKLTGAALEQYLPIYFEAFPDGPERQSWPGITYFLVRPKWIRYCDYSERPPLIREFGF